MLFRLRSFDSVSVIEFAILGFSAKVCARCAEVIYWLFSSVGGAFLAFQYFVSGGGAAFRREHFTAFQLLLGLPLCFMWLLLEVGLVEEFFFRALVQSQLAAAFKSEVSGIVLMSLIFGLAHAPGFIFRHAGELEGLGAHPSALDAIAYSIVVLAVSGITFGVIWARTKNLFALMLVHAVGDLLPNFGSFVRTWFSIKGLPLDVDSRGAIS